MKKIIIGLIGILFLFYLVSCNSTGDTSPGDVLPLPKATLPSAVGNLKVDSFTDNQVVLSWTAPTNTGTIYGTNATISGYLVKYKETVSSDFIEIDETSEGVRLAGALTGDSTNATVTGLDENTAYTFLVVAVHSGNVVGLDADAPTVEQTTPLREPTPPSAVRNLEVDSFTYSEVVISWKAPTNMGTTNGVVAATLSGYVVKYKRTADSEFTEIDETGEGVRLATALTSTSTNATVIGLSNNTSYTFLVVAVNSADAVGLDADAPKIEQTTIPAPPGKFRLAQCTKATSVDLTWDTSTGVTSYKLYRDDAEIANIITNFYTDTTDLAAETDYTYKVQTCTTVGCSGDSDPLTITTINDQDKNLRNLVDSGRIPTDLTGYDEMSREIFSNYSSGVPLVAKHLKPGGSGDGSSFASMSGNLKDVLDGITDAAADKVYAVFLAGGNYTNGDSVSMKNHVAIVGGVDECLAPSDTVTSLDGGGSYQVFNNDNNNLTNTALLYGVTVTNGSADRGGGMHNERSSPSLVRVTFSGNTADRGGGMYNAYSSPSLVRVTFSDNTARSFGGGIFNGISFPTLEGVTFSENTATKDGGGMYNTISSPTLEGVTFSGNTAVSEGGGMYNGDNSSPILEGVTFSGNTADRGGGIYNWSSSPTLEGVTFFENTAKNGGGMYNNNNNNAGPLIINGIFWGNTASTGPQFYFRTEYIFQENLRIYNSIVQGGTGNLVSGSTYTNVNQGGFVAGEGSAPTVISFSNISDQNPKLLPLADNGGSVLTHAIPNDSPAVNQGLYVKKSGTTFYYSADDTVWYTGPDLSGTVATVPADAVDVTDATGHTPTDQPDLGAYEYRDTTK